MNRQLKLFVLALGLIPLGGGLAAWVQTGGGAVRIVDVRVPGPNGIFQHGRLYVPRDASRETPAPGIVAIHGYINTNETQSGFAIEFSRRGYVVLAVDQTGHGYSDPPSGANGYGGPPALAFLRSLDFVDPDNIGLEGHSMGGWASVAAASAHPDGYRAIVLQGAGTGFGGDADALRNVAVVFSRYDEFSGLMWGTPEARTAGRGERMRNFFGTDGEVEVGRVYGSIESGTARVLHQPAVTHPGDHLSRAAIGHAVDWFQRTLDGGGDRPPTDQIWFWKEFGTLLALVGMVLLFFPVGGWFLQRGWFAELVQEPAPNRAPKGTGWWLTALVFTGLPAATLFPFKDLFGTWGLSASAAFPQNITSQVAIWATLVGTISAVLFVLWHLFANRGTARAGDGYGLSWEGRISWRRIAKSGLLALLVILTGYATLLLSDFFFRTDYRFWVFAVKPLSPLHLRIALSYFLPFTFFFLILGTALHGQLRRGGQSMGREMWTNVGLLTAGFIVLLLYQYVPLVVNGALADAGEALWTIIAIQFLPLMTIVGLVSTYFYRRTGHIYVGSFASALLVTWIVVASQATHFAF